MLLSECFLKCSSEPASWMRWPKIIIMFVSSSRIVVVWLWQWSWDDYQDVQESMGQKRQEKLMLLHTLHWECDSDKVVTNHTLLCSLRWNHELWGKIQHLSSFPTNTIIITFIVSYFFPKNKDFQYSFLFALLIHWPLSSKNFHKHKERSSKAPPKFLIYGFYAQYPTWNSLSRD